MMNGCRRISPLTWMLASLSALLVFISAAKLFIRNADGPWHLASGEYLLQQLLAGKFPYEDPFSFTPHTEKWINPAWLYDVLLAVVTQIGGTGFCVLLMALLTGGLAFLLCQHLLQRQIDALAVCTGMLLSLMLTVSGIAIRPQVITLYGAAIVYFLLHYARRKPLLLLWLPLVFFLWANLHGGLVLGFVIFGAFGLEVLVKRQWRYTMQLTATGIVCFMASLLNPYGWELYELIYRTMTGVMVHYIEEWGSPFAYDLWQSLAFYLFILLLCWPKKGMKFALADIVLLVIAVAMACQSIRHISVLGVLGVPLMCQLLEARLFPLSAYQNYQQRFSLWLQGNAAKQIACYGSAIILSGMIAAAIFYPRWDAVLMPAEEYPVAEIDYLSQHYKGCRTYPFYNYGGTVIYRSQGKVPVFFDSRAENVYSQQILADGIHIATLQGGWQNLLDKYGVQALLMPKEHPIFPWLVKEGSWQEAYAGDHAKLWVRKEIAAHPESCLKD